MHHKEGIALHQSKKAKTLPSTKILSLLLFSCLLFFTASPEEASPNKKSSHHPQRWNFLVYIAANNNLYRYGLKNMKQMQHIGSNKHINIFVQLDNFGKKESTRYHVKKGKPEVLKVIKKVPEGVSGTPESLFDFAKDVIQNFPAERTAIVLWDHGSGIKDPHIWGKNIFCDLDDLFKKNLETDLYELKKDFFEHDIFKRITEVFLGIAFNDIAHTYLTNQNLKTTFEKIQNELLGGKKIDLIGADACHMAMIEICSQIRKAGNVFVGSEEIEPGDGWDYIQALKPFLKGNLSPKELGKQIVTAYGLKYNRAFADLTQSSIDLTKIEPLEKNISDIAGILIELIKEKNGHNICKLISKARSATIRFMDADYIDLGHFLKNLLHQISAHSPEKESVERFSKLEKLIQTGRELVKNCIISQTCGLNVKESTGLSIYLPAKTIHSSYIKTEFAKNTRWCALIYSYLKKTRRRFAPETNFKVPPSSED